MSLVKNFSMCAALAAASLAMVSPTTALADVVVASSGPSAGQFPVGKKLAANDQITLKAGDTITVLGTGGTRVISGAGTHRVGAKGAAKRSTFATLTRQRDAARVRTGAVRGDLDGTLITRPNIWYVDVTQSGTMCVADADAVQLWRPGTEGAPTYLVASAASPDHVHLAFADGAMTTGWNTVQLPLTNGTTYTITSQIGGTGSEVTFVMLETAPEGPEELADALIANGCSGQLELLTSALM
jgi:hypothetical protein